jgi:hypothetical protein
VSCSIIPGDPIFRRICQVRGRPGTPRTFESDQSNNPWGGVASWRHWESEDTKVWVDLLTFTQPGGAAVALQAARQVHSGYIWANQLLLFSNTGDAQKEAFGAALALANGSLLNIGTKLPVAVHWDRPLPSADLIAFDGAFTRFLSTLDTVARTFLDPAYVTLGKKIEAKPEALSMLRIEGFARLWSYVKYNFVYLDRRPGLNWDSVLEQYLRASRRQRTMGVRQNSPTGGRVAEGRSHWCVSKHRRSP